MRKTGDLSSSPKSACIKQKKELFRELPKQNFSVSPQNHCGQPGALWFELQLLLYSAVSGICTGVGNVAK